MVNEIKVVELFAGVGGFRLGLEGWNGKSASSGYKKSLKSPYKVVWSNQWEPSTKTQHASLVYENRFGKNDHSNEDISQVDVSVIPDHDLLVGGFPCQDYSVATTLKNSKGLIGKKGVLWWNIHKILKVKRPKLVFLENVDRLLKSPTTKRGRDFAIMLNTLNELGYVVEWRVINAADFGMPQRRRRVYILAYHKTSNIKVNKPLEWIESEGVFATAFPCFFTDKVIDFELEKNIETLSNSFNEGKFLNAGIMKNGRVVMSDFKANCPKTSFVNYSLKNQLLGDVLLNGEMKSEPSYFLDAKKLLKETIFKITQPGFEIDQRLKRQGDVIELQTELDKWIYLKGRKSEERVSSKGKFYYKEGPLSLTDDLKKPSRTIITSEGGPGASRFKHLIDFDGELRRLYPVELERLNMFPDNHTLLGIANEKDVAISPARRAFFMGNALVVGVVERVGVELNKRII
jgi:DNA (cytosine-5)-methyltransferase 1